MLSKITSIKLAFTGLFLLISCFIAGVVLSRTSPYDKALKSLSRQLPIDWLYNEGTNTPLVATWLILLSGIAVLFFIHMVLCLFTRCPARFANQHFLRKWSFIGLHAAFLVVMGCHGLNMVLGYKISDIRLVDGDNYHFDKEFTITIADIQFVDAPRILETPYPEKRRLMTRDSFHHKDNFAEVVLRKNHTIEAAGRVMMLSPLRAGSIQVTLTDFFNSNQNGQKDLGVKLTIARNPIVFVFFAAYASLIFILMVYVVVNWRSTKNTQNRLPIF